MAKHRLTFSRAQKASIEGKVVDSAGKPAAEVFVLTLSGSGKLACPNSYQMAKTDANGGFLQVVGSTTPAHKRER